MQTEKDFLIALMNNTRDFNIAQSQNWYRIPCSTKIVPKSVLEKTLKYIAFYQTKIFGDQAFSVRWFAEVKSITVTKRKFLLPEFKNDPKAENDYYKIEFEPLQELNVPIISLRPRRLLFIPTTLWLFQNARNINELFCDSPLENEFWAVLKKEKIEAERQYYISTGYNKYLLDFAVFCKHCKIDIECDGDEYHLSEFNVKKDKRRKKGVSIVKLAS